jgi:hypothetical protein
MLKSTTQFSNRFGNISLTEHRDVRDFVFRGLLFESESEVFRTAGLKVGMDIAESEEQLLQEYLSPFGVQRRNNAMEMARLYAVLHAFENEIRSLVRDTLEEKVGVDWWDSDSVPKKVRANAENRQAIAEKDSWLQGAKSDRLEYVDFGDLSAIMIQVGSISKISCLARIG